MIEARKLPKNYQRKGFRLEKILHKSVLTEEVLGFLNIKPGQTYIDATLGGGGHTKKILESGGKVLGVDIDSQAVRKLLEEFSIQVQENDYLFGKSDDLVLAQGNFADLEAVAKKFGVWETFGILFDLGFSSTQLEQGKKGLSFLRDEPLDMRFDLNLKVTAADLINGLAQGELYELFSKFGEEPGSRRIARAITSARIIKKIETSGELASVVESVLPRKGKIHPATRVFLALRIAVNDELNNLRKGLTQAAGLLKPNGRVAVISFNSLEDRIVKKFFSERSDLKVLTKKPITPERAEVLKNPRSRSAKLRAAEKT